MINYNRRNTVWLAALSAMMALVLISDVAASVQLLLVAVFMAALVGSFVDFGALERNMQSLQQRSPLNRARMSADAREAQSRASSRPGYVPIDLTMIDIGLIASQTGRDGMAMRRTRSISKDDDGVRPFITLYVPADEADRNARLRYEITDHNGRELYVHEVDVYLRDGEMNILADHHLPLMKNEQVAGVGEWDLRVFLDGDLVGIHNFALTASYEQRRHRLNQNEYFITGEELSYDQTPEEDFQDAPMSLEDLLRSQSNDG